MLKGPSLYRRVLDVALVTQMLAGALCGQEANEPVAPAGPEAAAQFADAASLQNNTEFATAAEEWRKFIADFPNDPMIQHARHHLGVCYLQLNELDKASQEFAAVAEMDADFELLEEAYINWGWSLYSLGIGGDQSQLSAAKDVFQKSLARFPAEKAKLRDQALFYAGECSYLTGDAKQALDYYQQLITDFPDSKQRPDALYALGVLFQDQAKAENALKLFQSFVKDFGDHDLSSEIQLRIGEILMQQEAFEGALEPLDQARDAAKFPMADVAWLRYATSLQYLKRFEEAAKVFGELPEKFPQSPLRATAAMNSAKCWFQLQDWDQTQKALTAAEAADPVLAAEAGHYLTRIELERDEPLRALAIAESALTKATADSDRTRLLLDVADALYEISERRSEAEEAYFQLATKYPQSAEAGQALYNAAYSALEGEKFQVAIERAQLFLKQYGQHERIPDVRHVIAESSLMTKDFSGAEKEFTHLLREFPEHPDRDRWRGRLGVALQSQGKHDEALTLMADAPKPDENAVASFEASYLTAVSLAEKGELDKAIEQLDAILEQDPKNPVADRMLLLKSALQKRNGDMERALQGLKKLTDEFADSPLRPKAMLQHAEVAYSLGKLDDAEQSYSEVIRKYPDSDAVPLALYGQGWSRLRLNKAGEAELIFTDLLARFPKHSHGARALQARALARQRQEKWAEGLADAEAFLALEPSGELAADGTYVKALCELGLKQNAAARSSLERILEKYPEYVRTENVLYELAWMHLPSDNPLAIKYFKRLAKEFPKSHFRAEALLHVGDAAYGASHWGDAKQAYRDAIDAALEDSLRETAQYKLGFVCFHLKDWSEAKRILAQQLKQHPNGTLASEAKFLLGETLFAQKNYSAALQAYHWLREVALQNNSSNELKQLHAGQAAIQLREYQLALHWLQPLFAQDPPSALKWKARFEIGQAQRHLEKWNEAKLAYQEVAERNRDELGARARFMAAEVAFAQNEHDLALREFQKLIYGYGADQAPLEVKTWQNKAALEAGRCAAQLAQGLAHPQQRGDLLTKARKYFTFVIDRAPKTPEAEAARKQLDQLGPASRVSRAAGP